MHLQITSKQVRSSKKNNSIERYTRSKLIQNKTPNLKPLILLSNALCNHLYV